MTTQTQSSSNEPESVEVPKINQADAVAFSITFRRAGDKREGDKDEVTTTADKSNIAIVKTLFKAESFEAIKSHDGETRRLVEALSVPMFGRRGVWLIRKDSVPRIHRMLVQRKADREELVSRFVSEYPALVAAAQGILNGQYNADDYKAAADIQGKFGVDWYYLALGTPDNLPPEIRQEAQAKLEKQWQQAAQEVQDGLRIGFAQLVDHLIERLQPGSDGKQKRFHASNIDNILEFIDAMQSRNLTNDAQLDAVCSKAREIIANANPEQIRDSARTRDSLIEKLATVKEEAGKLVETVKGRRFDLDE